MNSQLMQRRPLIPVATELNLSSRWKQGNKNWREKTSPPRKSSTINHLPQEILLRIISFLPSIDAIRSSAVARSWRNLWISIPTLNFDVTTFDCRIPEKSNRDIYELFVKFIDKRLIFYNNHQQHLDLHQFKLKCENNECMTRNNIIGSWLRSVIAANVVELDLDFSEQRYSTVPDRFDFDSALFFDLIKSSVEVLKLAGVRFNEALCLRLESIREVHLERFASTEKEIGDLIASCVNLESLCLVEGWGLPSLKIESRKLKHMKLKCFNVSSRDGGFSVDICAPSLISLDLFCVYANKFALRLSSLAEAKVQGYECFNMSGCKYWTNVVNCLAGVERLSIQNMWPYRHRVPSETVVFHNLKHLELWTEFSKNSILSLENLLRQCPQLSTMVLIYTSCAFGYSSHLNCDYNPKDMLDIVFQVPRLRWVEMKDFKATKNVTCAVNLLKKHGVVLEKIVAFPRKIDGKPASLPYVL